MATQTYSNIKDTANYLVSTIRHNLADNVELADVYQYSDREYYYTVRKGNAITAIVAIVDRDSTRYGISYIIREVWECEGPRHAHCPISIIDTLSDTPNQYAQEWRTSCRKSASKRGKYIVRDGKRVAPKRARQGSLIDMAATIVDTQCSLFAV